MSGKWKRKGKAKFIMIEAYVKLCPAWKALTPAERNGYIEVKWRYDGTNNGRIGLGCRELGDELNMGRTAANSVLNGLIDKGFIVKAKPSAFHVKNRAVTEWRLTEYRCDVTGELPTKEFMKWAAKKKQQSSQADTQSSQADTPHLKTTKKVAHSPLRRTVGPDLRDPQSSQADTYRYTIWETAKPVPTREQDFGPWVSRNIPDPTNHREAFRLLREGKMTDEALRRMAA